MEYKIIWSKFAQFQLDLIFNYYSEKVSVKLAKKIIFQIRNHISELSKSPFIGKREEFLSEQIQDYRHLIIANYKIIYTVNEQIGIIKISDIFDTRQNPLKLKRN
ncbi:type II toxin-antitoxin system RelE/ParE family toxin [Polaribacter sp.]|uniref:type II toxin-antitoxin system RelE/ParE family toxin n=1 Tax=Polaribacter sp. TaxID=1920175 RepID=UPI00404727A0